MYQISASVVELERRYGTISNLLDSDAMGRPIIGPRDFIRLERLREIVFTGRRTFPVVSTDVLLLSLGELNVKSVSKIGGSPNRTDVTSWPVAFSGRPLTFLCQFAFSSDVKMLYGLPGTIMRVFVEDLKLAGPLPDLVIEWGNEGEPRYTEIKPQFREQFVTCWGEPFKTVDISDGEAARVAQSQICKVCKCTIERAEYLSHWLCCVYGMKVGGLPFCGELQHGANKGLRHLCSLSTVVSSPNEDWPWMNVERKMSFSEVYKPSNRLDMRDGFVLHLYWTTDGSVVPQIVFL